MQERSEAERRAIWPCLNVATTSTTKIDRIPFDPCNSIKRFDLCPFDQKNSTYLQPPLLSEVELEQRPNGNGDREAIVVGAGRCGEGERAYNAYAPHYNFAYIFVKKTDWKSGGKP